MNVTQRKGLQRFKKSCMVALLAAGLLMGAAGGAKAIDFKAQGEWLMGFGLADATLTEHTREPGHGPKEKVNDNDMFGAAQRLRLQLDAVASEALSGTVYFEIGTQNWGKADEGGALGADGNNVIKLKNAYIDWLIPQTDARMRMGIQALALPNMAGGSSILDADVAAVVGNYKFNENVGLTAFWARPVNDNFNAKKYGINDSKAKDNYLDNMDLFAVSLPMTFDGIEITPWAMYGLLGRNALRGLEDPNNDEPWATNDGVLGLTIPGLTPGFNYVGGNSPLNSRSTSKQYGNMFWAGLPVGITMFDPLNIEFDINYGYVEEMGRFDVMKRGDANDIVRGSTQRQGFVVKALVEYKLDWATPGIFGWYGSGDDGNIKNGSERMPSIAGAGNFTSFVGDGNLAWGAGPGDVADWNMSYAGTWGIGGQLKDISFLEDLKHTLRVAYWGGTNAPSMVKYMENAYSWREGYGGDGPYLTTNDGLLEFNLINQWQIYENLEANLELGYVVNMMDQDTWKKDGYYNGGGNGSFDKKDAWKAQLVFAYSF